MTANLEPYTLSTSALSLSLLPYGLTFSSFLIKLPSSSSESRDVLIGPRDLGEHVKHRRFLNQTVGRYANRLPIGQVGFGWEKELNLELNEGVDVCLHGGKKGIDTFNWERITPSESKLFNTKSPSSSSVIFTHTSAADADGFPHTLIIEAYVCLTEPKNEEKGVLGRLEVVLAAKIADEEVEDAKTPVNLTVHWGFNLGSFDGKEDEHVKDHKMFIDADRTPELARNMLATGKSIELEPKSPLRFTEARKIGSNFPKDGIDHNLIFTSPSTNSKPRVILTSPDEKLSLEFKTNQASVQCYTAAGFDGKSFVKKEKHDHGGEGRGYPQFGANFLEFHQPLATFLHEEFKKIVGEDTVLKKGERYENWCEVTVKGK